MKERIDKKRSPFLTMRHVQINLRKKRFPASKRKSELNPRFDGPFQVLEKVNDNAYKVELPCDYGVSATISVADLSPFYDDEEVLSSFRTNSSKEGEDDGGRYTSTPSTTKDLKLMSTVALILHEVLNYLSPFMSIVEEFVLSLIN